MSNKKGAIGLSVNVLVIIIISMVILFMGVSLLYNFIDQSEQSKKELDARTQQELERILIDQGKPTALPLRTATIERGEHHVFGLGILNFDTEATGGNTFKIRSELSKVVDEGDKDITDQLNQDVMSWIYHINEVELNEGQYNIESIFVSVPKNAQVGTYIFNVKVTSQSGNVHGNVQKFYVNVK
jgi:hypothetical protein